ncbi:hypothetical protein FLX56_24030 [Synechococcus moorigangaii CMS01]|nr:hypothetical protein [Synechococcus moorigangaii CMS01]
MAFLKQKIAHITLFSVVVTAGLLPTTGAIAKPGPRHQRAEIEQNLSQGTGLSGRQVWGAILDELQDQYRDIPDNRFSQLRADDFFRDQLLSLLWGQTGDRFSIREILTDVLLNGSRSENSRGYYYYNVDRRCLPPGQQQRLASGKPIPPGILQKCGRPIFRNY